MSEAALVAGNASHALPSARDRSRTGRRNGHGAVRTLLRPQQERPSKLTATDSDSTC
jgi:hypothetical protein